MIIFTAIPAARQAAFRPLAEPLAIVELVTIRSPVSDGAIVCSGGGGIPVRCDGDGILRGVEAVIDKDRTAALLATLLGADLLLYLTDVGAVAADRGSAFCRPIRRMSPAALVRQRFDETTMGPKGVGLPLRSQDRKAGGDRSVGRRLGTLRRNRRHADRGLGV